MRPWYCGRISPHTHRRMTDRWGKDQRSKLMARVRNKNTGPELQVRRILHRLGYRFRLHRRDLPGSPDIVLSRHMKAIFVHGCFWHGHDCPKGRRPRSRTEFWNKKLDVNLARDHDSSEGLRSSGWDVLIVWECETTEPTVVEGLLKAFLEH